MDRSHTQRRPASANLQCTKSRKEEYPAAAGSMAMAGLRVCERRVLALMVDGNISDWGDRGSTGVGWAPESHV
jgi:hypothetical protein